MSSRATGSFTIEKWDEQPYEQFDDGRKLARASVVKRYQGDIEGEGRLEYLLAYAPDGSASFVGMERIAGRLGGRAGSFVLQHQGTFTGGVAESTWFVVPGSGAGELAGLQGEGGFAAGHADQYGMTLDYTLP